MKRWHLLACLPLLLSTAALGACSSAYNGASGAAPDAGGDAQSADAAPDVK